MQYCAEWIFKMSTASCNAGCQSLVPFTDGIVNHFLVRMVPFLLDMLAALPRPWSIDACTHAPVGSPTPRSRRGSDPDKTRSWTSLIVSGLRAVRGRPLPEQRSTMPVASILLSTVWTPLNVLFLFQNILSIFVAPYSFCSFNTFIVCLSSSEKGTLRNV